MKNEMEMDERLKSWVIIYVALNFEGVFFFEGYSLSLSISLSVSLSLPLSTSFSFSFLRHLHSCLYFCPSVISTYVYDIHSSLSGGQRYDFRGSLVSIITDY